VTGCSKVTWLAEGNQTTGRRMPWVSVDTAKYRKTRQREEASGCLALIKGQRRDRHVLLDTATRRAHAALLHHIANAFFTLAAAHGHAEFELQFVEGIHSLGDGGPNLSVGN
jgi:hypothetical protein